MQFTIRQIASLIGAEIEGDDTQPIHMLAKIQDAKPGQISFLSNPKYENFIYDSKASAVIVSKNFEPKEKVPATLLRVEDPYNSFTILLEEYHKFISFQRSGIESPSFIGENSKTGDRIYRGAFSYIGKNVTIGNDVKIYPNCFIGDNVTIGDSTILHSGVKIYDGTRIGQFCVIHAGCVIGSDGFGFAPQEDGSYRTIPQMGHVIVGNHVDIGANTVIDCATMHGDATRIGNGVKLDNLIQIAHNVEIGDHTVIAAQTGISGSTKIGKGSTIAGQVGIAGHLVFGDKTRMAAKSGLIKSYPDGNIDLMGAPAMPIKDYLRAYAVFRKLPDLNARLKELEEKVVNLPTFDKRS
ncbi:UDP-3-O-(3-hydroxymyristoyl)glucosamine N-acyltransferase [Fulvivirga sedimenti]|uniref:UDP-3-O-acylglucosamine N-acyltransferase n=1 Tax=Fulvivirga sedimenti TaxID=2879465 RepID=A0A9X1HPD4_9BACT|nr:UDP-3-O-(3-hydroxymyristoyl)glucosamine N-acyltransferase [Fulvivirga sedimenti]MCA6073874.1 UDP-3-O-(3-hydroxymyristoyl)glucosamine N-acyltransferase [Fulvivirga sedimenti]